MRRAFATAVLVLVMLFFLLTAWRSGIAPERFARGLGFAIADAGGFNEILAQYTGFFLFAAGLCFAALIGRVPRQSAFLLMIVIFGGLFVGRLVSLGINNGFSGYDWLVRALYVIDAVGLVLGVTALLLDRPSQLLKLTE